MVERANERGRTSRTRRQRYSITLILVAAVANLNLAVANVALPDIGKAFDAGQTPLNLVAVGYSLGLAASVLYLGALGDRYGRKMMLILGTALAIPACLPRPSPRTSKSCSSPACRRPRGRHGLPDHPRPDHGALDRGGADAGDRPVVGVGGAISALGPLASGALLHFDWGSVFLITAAARRGRARPGVKFVPAHVNEVTDPVDNLGGIMSIVLVAALVLGDQLRQPCPARPRSQSGSA